ncbi:tensin-3-like isoform X1 [Paramormyrops kingsleyae]|uniref:tensin-3-like isoform X1 n=1 Tax=Paramormyrops kingsleyae TaxID=1676925 RepID=UPI003B979C02
MEEGYELDLTYITERIIAVSFPVVCSEDAYRANLHDVTCMLKSKHADNYLVINLSEKRADLTKTNPKTLDTGWADLHAPPLDKICTICKAMETWLNSDPQHVVVIHCRGGKGRIGVITSSFVHFTEVSASADQALERFAMRKFYDDKVSPMMTPSQKRYVWILNSLLTGSIKMNTSPHFLHCVILHGIPDFENGVCRPYLKVYQGMQLVYSSGIYHIGAGHRNRLYIALQPAQLLKGDILVKCYHKNIRTLSREPVFRLQFHTGTVQGCSLIFEKEDLENANKDPRFPDYGKVELVMSESPEKMQGSERWENVPAITVEYNTADPLIRWDSYQNISCDAEVSHAQDPKDARPPAKVGQRGSEGVPQRRIQGAPARSDHTASTSSDSGLSSASLRTGRSSKSPSEPRVRPSRLGCEQGEPPSVMSERGSATVGRQAGPGELRPKQQETDILDDEVPAHDLRSVDSLGTLSSSDGPYGGHHEGSQNSLLSEGFGSGAGEEYALARPREARGVDGKRTCYFHRSASVSPEVQPLAFGERGYSTQTWVHHQQMVAAQQYTFRPTEGAVRFSPSKQSTLTRSYGPQDTPTHGGALQRAHSMPVHGLAGAHSDVREDDLASLNVDIDQSIDQLNQLILDLDPTFVPVPTRSNSSKRGGGALLNGSAGPCTNGMSYRLLGNNGTVLESTHQPDTTASDYRAGTRHGLSRQDSVTEHLRWGIDDEIQNSAIYTPGLPSSQLGILYRSDSIENKPHCEEFSGKVPAGAEMVASTPAFPIPPPTPYVKDVFEFSHAPAGCRPGASLGMQRTERESRGYPESLGHSAVSLDGEGFPVAFPAPPNPAAYQRPFASMRAASVDGLVSRTESLNSKPRLRQQCSLGGSGPGFTSQYPGSLEYNPQTQYGPTHTNDGTPSYHSRYPPSCSSGQSFEEHDSSSPGGGDLGVNGVPEQPPLPEKRRVSQGEHGLGFGSHVPSNHSGSPTNIPCGSPLPDPLARAASAPPSVHDVFAGKQETVKFVQDTSKFWYKPDISRDQAIAVLKDKEPGSFIVRDSHSFRGAYGLAMKVATPPPSVLQQSKRGGDLSNELVRHFLIERTQKGVRLKGCPKEPNFGSLTALVCHHSVSSLALPCMLIIPDRDPLEDIVGPSAQTAANSAAELLKQGAACNVWFLGSVEMESLTGYQAVQKATSLTLAMDPPPISTVVHFKVSAQGITLTDNQRKLFFRRHHAVNTVIFCALDPQDRKWTRDGSSLAKIFGFVARKGGSATENVCHLFAEHDPEQPASAIVNFVSKVMIGSAKTK